MSERKPGCNLILDRLDEYHDGLLSTEVREEIARHLGACVTCEREYREVQSFAAILATVPPGPSAPAALMRKVRAELDAKVSGVAIPLPVARVPWRVVGTLAAAAAVLVAVLGILVTWQKPLCRLRSGKLYGPGAEGGLAASLPGTALDLGRRAQTQAGPAELEFADGSLVHAEPRTQIELVSLSPRRSAEDPPLEIFVGRGTIRCTVTPGRSAFQVNTPAGKVRVLGTEFWVSVEQLGGRDPMEGGDAMNEKLVVVAGGAVVTVAVVAGLVSFKNDQREVEIGPGEMVQAAPERELEKTSWKQTGALKDELSRVREQIDSLRERVQELEVQPAPERSEAAPKPTGPAVRDPSGSGVPIEAPKVPEPSPETKQLGGFLKGLGKLTASAEAAELARRLKLNSEQKRQVKQIVLEQYEAGFGALGLLLSGEDGDFERLAEMEDPGDNEAARLEAEQKIQALLTADQWVEYQKYLEEREKDRSQEQVSDPQTNEKLVETLGLTPQQLSEVKKIEKEFEKLQAAAFLKAMSGDDSGLDDLMEAGFDYEEKLYERLSGVLSPWQLEEYKKLKAAQK